MSRRAWFIALRWGVTLAALALIFRALSAEAIVAALRETKALWVALAVLALAAQIGLSALRWRFTAGALGVVLPQRAALAEYWLGVLGNTVLPGGVLGDVGRAVRLRAQAGLAMAAETVVIERLAGQIALGFTTLGGVAVWFWPEPRGLACGAGMIVLAALVALVTRKGGGRVRRDLRAAWVAGGIWRAQLGLSAAILAANVLGFWAAAQAVGVALSLTEALFVLPLTLTAMLLPISINGWGLREAAAAGLWPLAGVAPAAAVAASLVFGIAALAAALPGVLVLLRSGTAPLKPAQPRPE